MEINRDVYLDRFIVEKSMKPRYDENGYLMMGVKEFLSRWRRLPLLQVVSLETN